MWRNRLDQEVDFKTMESKLDTELIFRRREVLDVDAITGGFNFQAAWTTGYIAGSDNYWKKVLCQCTKATLISYAQFVKK
jgi:hypothetical protein